MFKTGPRTILPPGHKSDGISFIDDVQKIILDDLTGINNGFVPLQTNKGISTILLLVVLSGAENSVTYTSKSVSVPLKGGEIVLR
jgi:hypothetical protein